MNYAMLPPETNSGRMYTGPGSGPMLGVAQAWEGLAAELHSAAHSYGAAISELTSAPWQGPASARMAASAAPYLAWLNRTAEQAEQTGSQAKAAASAHATAYATTVPPPAIAANRAQLAALVASNVVGQNTPAIATTESNYDQMWAQDASAMHRYAADSQLASRLAPFNPPRQNTNPDSAAAQSAAAGESATTSTANSATQVLQTLASGAGQLFSGSGIGDFANLYNEAILLSIIGGNAMGLIGLLGITGVADAESDDEIEVVDPDRPAIVAAPGTAGGASSAAAAARPLPAAAALGQADSLSGLSVPRAWASTAPEMRLAAGDQPTPRFVAPKGNGSIFGEMPLFGGAPLVGLPGRGSGGSQTNRPPQEPNKRGDTRH